MNHDEPRPLDGPDGEAPETLVRALRALSREQPSQLALSAAARRFEAALDQAQLSPPAAKWSTLGLGTKLLVGALVIGGGTLALESASPVAVAPRAPALQAAVVEPTPAPRPAPVVVPARVERAAQDRQVSKVRVSSPALAPSAAAPSHAVARTTARAPAALGLATPVRASAPTSAEVAESSAEATAAEPSEHIAPTVVSPVQAPEVALQRREERPAQGPDGELTLLLSARKHAHDDPEATLRATNEHARRYPAGALAPEREVLAIRALRALGRSSEAAQRLARFRVAYPDSVHLPGLDAR